MVSDFLFPFKLLNELVSDDSAISHSQQPTAYYAKFMLEKVEKNKNAFYLCISIVVGLNLLKTKATIRLPTQTTNDFCPPVTHFFYLQNLRSRAHAISLL